MHFYRKRLTPEHHLHLKLDKVQGEPIVRRAVQMIDNHQPLRAECREQDRERIQGIVPVYRKKGCRKDGHHQGGVQVERQTIVSNLPPPPD